MSQNCVIDQLLFREVIGPDLVFINLQMSSEDRRKRVLERHVGDEASADMMDVSIHLHLNN